MKNFIVVALSLLMLSPIATLSARELTLKECLEEFGKINQRPRPRSCPRLQAMPPLSAHFSQKGADCRGFIGDDGSYGPYGQVIQSYIQSQGSDSILLSNNLASMNGASNICPNWKKFDEATKTHFWVWTFAAIAHAEDTCKNSQEKVPATNGYAIGLLQMDYTVKARSWRGPNCKAKNIGPYEANLKCGLDIMSELMLGPRGEYKGPGLIYGANSYWQKLKGRTGGDIGEKIRAFPLCH